MNTAMESNRGPNDEDVNIRIIRLNRLGTFFSSISFVERIEFPPAMTQAQLHEIPKVTITQEQAGASIKCAVCLDEFEMNENEVCKLPCNHLYHDACVFPWLVTNPSCPVCRAPLLDANNIIRQQFDRLRLTADTFRRIVESHEQLRGLLPHVHYWRMTPEGLLPVERLATEGGSIFSARTRRHETAVNDSVPARRLPQRAAALRASRAIHNIYRQRRTNDGQH